MTSTLQQTASSMLGFSPKKTMQIAQKLYEGVKTPVGNMGIITYMRTDSLNIAKEAQDAAIEFIKNEFGDKYLNPTVYKSKAQGAQEAHEAIRPTEVKLTPDDLRNYLSSDLVIFWGEKPTKLAKNYAVIGGSDEFSRVDIPKKSEKLPLLLARLAYVFEIYDEALKENEEFEDFVEIVLKSVRVKQTIQKHTTTLEEVAGLKME
jgi:hypothetical protein